MIKHAINGKKSGSKNSLHKKTQVENQSQKNQHNKQNGLNGLMFKDTESNLALGAAAFAAVGMAAFLLFKPKKQKLRNNTFDKVKNAYEYATDYAENIKDTAHEIIEHPYSGSLLTTGILGGTLLGASAIYLLTTNSKRNSENLIDKMSHAFDTVKETAYSTADNIHSSRWVNAAQEIIESLVEKAATTRDEIESHKDHNFLNNALEMGLHGFRAWKNMRRK